MSTQMDRRQFGKRLLAGTAVTVAGGNTSRAAVCAEETTDGDDTRSETRWNPVAAGIWKATIGIPDAITPVSSRLEPAAKDALSKLPEVATPAFSPPIGAIGRRGVTVRLPLDAREQIYGFGLQFHSMTHRGRKRTIRVNADPTNDSGDTHAPVPFYVSNKGYGIFIDTARHATFYCGDSRPKPSASRKSEEGGLVPLYVDALGEDDASQVVVEIPRTRGIDVYLFAGPTMLDAVRRYNLFSGGGVLPPEWGLGFWYRAASNAHDCDILALAKEFRDRNISCDVIGLEPGWHSHAYSCSFEWHPERFSDPQAFLRQLATSSYRVNLWEHAFVHPSSPLFRPLYELSGDTAVWGGLVPDFQNASARRVFGEYHGKSLIDIGVSGFKLDECDNSDFTGGWSFADLSHFPSGVDGEQMHSLFGLRYQSALWEPFQKRGLETYSLVRSSGALAAPYPFVLYSDLYDHRQFVRALVNSSFCGLLWCPEVRDAKTEEDLIRRLQTVVFSPLAMINGWYISNPPWKQLDRKKNNANEIAPDWEALEARCREIIGWRMQIIPYLRAAFARYRADGTPPFRALALDWPDVPALAKTDDAWMVGDRILVAPLFAGERNGRKLTLPPGKWFDFWTGAAQPGDTTIEIPAATRNIPVFVKAGSVIPLATITNSTADKDSHSLQVRVFGDGQMPFVLKTESGSVQISWDARTASGVFRQSGGEKYKVVRWS